MPTGKICSILEEETDEGEDNSKRQKKGKGEGKDNQSMNAKFGKRRII
jgi:hypothetical protein